jgi:pimeloyl-ACP methyl ester carboxylesterase
MISIYKRCLARAASIAILFALGSWPGSALAFSPQSGLAEVNGTKLFYEMAGNGHALVLIHGGGADRRVFDDQFEAFSAHYKVIRYDLRGSGKSEVPQTRYTNTEDLYALLRYLKVDKAYVLGLSRGGGVAFDFTLAHPEMVDGLVLQSANLSNMPRAYKEMISSAAKAGREEGIARAVQIWLNDPYQGPDRENAAARKRVQEVLHDNLATFLYFWGGSIAAEPGARPAAERLTEIHAPTLVIAGERDNEDARANYDHWAKGIPHAKEVVIPGGAHLNNIDNPKEFNRVVLEFLSKI